MSAPLAYLDHVARLVAEHSPGELACWFQAGVDAFLDGKAHSLDSALGLSGPGLDAPATRIARERRNTALRRAWGLMRPLQGERAPERRRRFLQTLRAFEVRVLPRMQSGARAPVNPLEAALLAVFEAKGTPLPQHERSLQRILNENWTPTRVF